MLIGFGVAKVCRIMALYRSWAIILPTLGGLGYGLGCLATDACRELRHGPSAQRSPQQLGPGK